MCGLFGWIWGSQEDYARRSVFAAIVGAFMDERGGDSYGYAKRNGEIEKDLGQLTDGVDAVTLAKESWLLAHTRKATTGTIIRANSHPFRIGQIIGAHNGIVSNDDELNALYKRNCAVDSEHLFCHLSEGRSMKDIHAYGAIEWIESDNPSTIYLAKLGSDFSELSIAQLFPRHKGQSRNKEAVAVVWASTAKAISQGAAMAGLVPTFYEVKGKTIYSVEEKDLGVYRHSTIEIGDYWDLEDYQDQIYKKKGYWQTGPDGKETFITWKEWDRLHPKIRGGGGSVGTVAMNGQDLTVVEKAKETDADFVRGKDRSVKIWDYCDMCNKTVLSDELCERCIGCLDCCYCCERCGEIDIRRCRCEIKRISESSEGGE